MAALITLTTDFGTTDSYVAELKGVLYSEGPPELRVVDLSHGLRPFDVTGAALFVRAALPRFPPHTVHLAVVDPGVGSSRRALIVQLPMMTLVGPDNGLFSHLYDGREVVYAIDEKRLGTRTISRTFHGRDVFAPVAAQLSAGVSAASFGPQIDRYERFAFPLVDMQGDVLHGHVVHVDHYGNLITNITEGTLSSFLEDGGASATRLQVTVAGHSQPTIAGVVGHYAQAEPGALLALIGSAGLLEIAARESSAALALDIDVGGTVSVRRRG
jgi:S-adenosylmethionine hydrolase